MPFALSFCVLLISLMQLVNRAQCLNITPLFLSFARLAAASAHALVTIIVPLTSLYVSL